MNTDPAMTPAPVRGAARSVAQFNARVRPGQLVEAVAGDLEHLAYALVLEPATVRPSDGLAVVNLREAATGRDGAYRVSGVHKLTRRIYLFVRQARPLRLREGVDGSPYNAIFYGGRAIDPRLDLENHSPTGFEWGYGGSGPAQAALAVLAHHTGKAELAQRLHQAFKWAFIAPSANHRPHPRHVEPVAVAWELPAEAIDRWLLEQVTA